MAQSCKGTIGQGTTLSLSIDSVIARVRNVQLPEWILEAVDFTGLENDPWMCFKPGGVVDPGSFVAELYFNPTIVLPTVGLVQNATFLFPLQVPGNTRASLTGSGFITGLGWPNAAVSDPMIQTITFKYDGDSSKPAFVVEAGSPEAAEQFMKKEAERKAQAIQAAIEKNLATAT